MILSVMLSDDMMLSGRYLSASSLSVCLPAGSNEGRLAAALLGSVRGGRRGVVWRCFDTECFGAGRSPHREVRRGATLLETTVTYTNLSY